MQRMRPYWTSSVRQVVPPNGWMGKRTAQGLAGLVPLTCPHNVVLVGSEGGMIRLETLIELKFLNSSFSSCSPIEMRQTARCRAIRGNSISVNSTLPPPLIVGARSSLCSIVDVVSGVKHAVDTIDVIHLTRVLRRSSDASDRRGHTVATSRGH